MYLLIFACLIIYLIYTKIVQPSLYWKHRAIFYVSPWDMFSKMFFGSKSVAENIKELYDGYPDRRYIGCYQFLKPSLFVRDLNLIKQITVKDFDHFTDHVAILNEQTDPIMGLNLLSLKGEKWRDMRATLSPTFTSSKMRTMLVLIAETAQNFTSFFLDKDDDVVEMEMKEAYCRYTNDVIASCAFGIKCDSLKHKDNEFFKMGKSITTIRGRGLLCSVFPGIFKFFRIPVFSTSFTNFFKQIILDTVFLREKEGIVRPDMIHLLMEARKGRLTHDNQTSKEVEGFSTVEESSIGKNNSQKMPITDDLMTAQAMIFFVAGFETASTLLSFLSYELAVNPEIQLKLQKEIDEVFKNSTTAKVSYEEILKMKYLDQVVSEALRKFPPAFILNRFCGKDYVIPAKTSEERTITIEKDCVVIIPVHAIHMDPKFFPNPEVFDPDRFSEENRSKIVPGSYMPFGSGPRNCIGSRFALLEIKALTVNLLSKFDIVPIQKTTIPFKLEKSFSLAVKGGCWLGLKKRN